MRVTTLYKETNLADIADRLFANLTPETRRIAEKALMEANPELAKPEVLRPGTIIRVPEVPALKLKAAHTEDDPVGQTREMLKKALKSYQGLLGERLEAELKELTTQTALLKQLTEPELLEDLVREARVPPALNPTIEDLKRTLERRMKENAVEARDLLRALDRALKDLAE